MKPRPTVLVLLVGVLWAAPLLAQSPVSKTFPFESSAVYTRTLDLARRSFVTVRPNPKRLEIAFEQQNQGQEVKGTIRVQPANGGSKVSVQTAPEQPPIPSMGPSGRGGGGGGAAQSSDMDPSATSTGDRFDRFTQNIQDGEAYDMKLNAGINLAKNFLAALQKQLAAEPPAPLRKP